MFVYRVETEEGWGPYSWPGAPTWQKLSDLYRRNTGTGTTISPYHPIPEDDDINLFWLNSKWNDRGAIGTWDYSDIFFGFEDLVSLDNWFCKHVRRQMNKVIKIPEGYRINVYKIQKKYVGTGNHQIVFLKKKAKHVKTLSLVSMEEIIQETDNAKRHKAQVCATKAA